MGISQENDPLFFQRSVLSRNDFVLHKQLCHVLRKRQPLSEKFVFRTLSFVIVSPSERKLRRALLKWIYFSTPAVI